MTPLSVSVIVVSRGRPNALVRCLKGIEQLFYKNLEVIIVSDPAGAAAVAALDIGDRIKLIEFDEPNISSARNLGLAHAAGQIVAFIDDDAVPEPSWLDGLIAPFADASVAAAGGYVIGRNGISFQSTAQFVDVRGWPLPFELGDDAPVVLQGKPGKAIKTEGTNCAFRRHVLTGLGGFDPAFAFYMDETDVNLRLAALRAKTAIVPLAQVHHGFAASARRYRSRMPRTLFDVGASHMMVLRKHAPPDRFEGALTRLRAEQRARLLRHMVAGNCEPRDVRKLLQTLEDGIATGRTRPIAELPSIGAPESTFKPFLTGREYAGSQHIAGRNWSRNILRAQAASLVADGRRVSLFLFSPTTFYHRVSFDPRGFWEQRGGLFGKSRRSDPVFKRVLFTDRVQREVARVDPVRQFTC